MDNAKEAGQLQGEIVIILERLKKMSANLTSPGESPTLLYYTCKSYYQQVSPLRRRFYEILSVLRFRMRNKQPMLQTAKEQIVLVNPKQVKKVVSPKIATLPVSSPSISVSPNQTLISSVTSSEIKISSPIQTVTAVTLPSGHELNLFLNKATEQVDNLTMDIEKMFFALEAENKKNAVVQNLDFVGPDGKMSASSITLNINGNLTLNMAEPGISKNLQVQSPVKPILKNTTEKKEEKPDLDQLNKIIEAKGDSQETDSAEIERRKNLFYNRLADSVLEFSNGETLKVSSALLIEKSFVFDNIFTRSQQIKVIRPFPVYKLFLDCLMEFQNISFQDALQIFPLAHEANVEKLIEKCKKVLKPVELDENISLTLNMAVSIRNEDLVAMLINFLLGKGRIYFFFNEEKLYFPLSPESVRELLCHLDIDEFIMKRIFNWGENYLKVYNETDDLKIFFTKHRIMEKLAAACFETMGVKF